MRKLFVIDTSVLVYDPNSFASFIGNDILIPITVLDELDKVKKLPNESGRNARVAIRKLDEISNLGEIHIGIKIDNDILLKIDTSAYGSIGAVDQSYGDNKILACAAKAKVENSDSKVILVSKDINLRTRAKALGLTAQDYENDKIRSEELYEGFRVVTNTEAGNELKNSDGSIDIGKYEMLTNMYQNECVTLENKSGKGLAAGRRVGDKIIRVDDISPWGLSLRNQEQLYASSLLMDRSIPLVSLVGLAGSGKTLISLANGLELVLNKKMYDSFLIYRPIEPMGNDLGYMPGSLEEKLNPWFSAIDDGFALLFSDRSKKKDGWKTQLFQYIENGTIQKEALMYIRGRSIPNALILIDEAQNLSKDEMRTILTRAGVGSKIILTGDLAQIDSPYLDATNNGLSYVINKFKGSKLFGHIALKKGERSELATYASEIL